MASLVTIGKIIKPQGINGELRIAFYADDLSLLEKPLLIRLGNLSPRPIRTKKFRIYKDVFILSIEGCSDRSTAENFRGYEIVIEDRFLPEETEQAEQSERILGWEVFSVANEKIGTIHDIQFPAGKEVWSILSERGHEVLFPAVPQFICSYDEDAKRIIVNPPAGLLEIYAG